MIEIDSLEVLEARSPKLEHQQVRDYLKRLRGWVEDPSLPLPASGGSIASGHIPPTPNLSPKLSYNSEPPRLRNMLLL